MSDVKIVESVIKTLDFFFKKYVIGIIFFVCLIVQICAINNTIVLHLDEPSTFSASTPSNNIGLLKKYAFCYFSWQDGVEYDFRDIYNFLFVPKKDLTHLKKDLLLIRTQKFDNSHPSLYYLTLRIWNITIKNYTPYEMLKHAKFLNLLFYLISFFYMYKLLNLIFDKKDEIYTGIAFAFGSTAIVSLSSLTREYALQSALFVVSTYIFTLLYKKTSDKDITIFNTYGYGLGIGLFLLSGYGALIYASIHSAILFLVMLFRKNKRNILQLILILIIVFTTIKVLCPNYFYYAINNDNSYTLSGKTPNHYSFKNILYSLFVLKHIFMKYIFYKISFWTSVTAYIISIIIYVKNKNIKDIFNKKDLYCLFLIFVCFIWSVIIMIVTPFKVSRYVLAAFPVFGLLYVLLLKNSHKIIKIFVCVLFIAITINHVTNDMYFDHERSTHFIYKYRYRSAPLILNDDFWYVLPYMYINPNKFKTFIYYKDFNPQNSKYKNYYLMTEKYLLPSNNTEPFSWFDKLVIYYIHNE